MIFLYPEKSSVASLNDKIHRKFPRNPPMKVKSCKSEIRDLKLTEFNIKVNFIPAELLLSKIQNNHQSLHEGVGAKIDVKH